MPVLIDVFRLAAITQLDEVRVLRHPGVRMSDQRAPATGKRHLVFRCQLLCRKRQHVVFAEKRVQRLPRGVIDMANVDPFDDRSEWSCQTPYAHDAPRKKMAPRKKTGLTAQGAPLHGRWSGDDQMPAVLRDCFLARFSARFSVKALGGLLLVLLLASVFFHVPAPHPVTGFGCRYTRASIITARGCAYEASRSRNWRVVDRHPSTAGKRLQDHDLVGRRQRQAQDRRWTHD